MEWGENEEEGLFIYRVLEREPFSSFRTGIRSPYKALLVVATLFFFSGSLRQ